MKKLISVAALLSMASLGASSVLARGGDRAPEIRIPEVREPREIKVPQIRIPEVREPKEVKVPEIRVPEARDIKVREPKEVKAPEVRAPAAVRQPGPGNEAALRAAPTPAANAGGSGSSAAASSPTRPEGRAGSDLAPVRSFDSRAAFLESAVAIRVGQSAAGAQTSVKLLADYHDSGVHCRDYQQTVLIDRQRVKAIGTVCQGRDGRWALTPHQTAGNARGNR